MKKSISLSIILVLLFLTSCNESNENKETRFILDTIATITADCDDSIISGAFDLCSDYEKKLSRTIPESDVAKLNNSISPISVSDDTLKIINRSIYYSDITNGKFDITICPVSMLWDFKNQVIPNRDEISEALKNVDYHSISVNDNSVFLNGKKIDLGSIAKGYIADRIKEYLQKNNCKNAIVNLGGNVLVYGKKYTVGIQKPFSDDIVLTVDVTDKSVVTSGIYQRYIKKDNKIYHHIIDPSTGYGVQNELASVTVIGNESFDCDALSTVCMLEGTKKGTDIIESIKDTEAIFIDRDGKITLTSGIYREKDKIIFK